MVRGGAELGKFRAIRRDQQRDPFQVGLLVVQLTGERRAVGVMAATEQSVGLRRNDLVDDRAEIRGRAAIGLVQHNRQVLFLGEVAGGVCNRFGEGIVLVHKGDLGIRIFLLERL